MTGKLSLVLLLLVCIHGFLDGVPIDVQMRCKCPKTRSDFIPPKKIANVEINAEGPHCSTVEVIAELHSGEKVCLNPNAKWVNFMIKKLMHSGRQRN
ncbi:alveolar macrophage chemotactic factor [Amia ocellicauda]|uniref:alveolar macrophage chemotactic factor n=1 Tax=Amia ocellicauda TaxID=2972642 RepID=UPI0034638AFE